MPNLVGNRIIQLVKQAAFNTYDSGGAAHVLLGVEKGQFFEPQDEHSSHKPAGFSEEAWAAITKSARVLQGTWVGNWGDWVYLKQFLLKYSDSDASGGVTTDVDTLPLSGARGVPLFTVEYGSAGSCDRMLDGYFAAFGPIEINRDNRQVTAAFAIVCQAPASDAVGIAMTGTPTIGTRVPWLPNQLSVKSATTIAGLGSATAESGVKAATINIGGALAEHQYFAGTGTHYRAVNDVQSSKSLTLLLDQAASLASTLRSAVKTSTGAISTTRAFRVAMTYPGGTYSATFDIWAAPMETAALSSLGEIVGEAHALGVQITTDQTDSISVTTVYPTPA